MSEPAWELGTQTFYNGTGECADCGQPLLPNDVLFSPTNPPRCQRCRSKRHHKHVKGRMA